MKKAPFNFLLLPQIGSVLLGLMGLVLLFWPAVLVNVFPPLVGIVLILVGVHGIAYYAANRGKPQALPIRLLQSVVTLAVGLVFIIKNDVTSAFLAILFGMYIIAIAVLGMVSAVRGKLRGRELWGAVAQSLVCLVWGLMLLLAPFSGRHLWVQCLGGFFVVIAVSNMVRIRAVQKQLEEKFRGFFGGGQGKDDEAG